MTQYIVTTFSVDEGGNATRSVEAELFEYHSDHVVFYNSNTVRRPFLALHVNEVAEIREVAQDAEFQPPFAGFDFSKSTWKSTYPVTPEPPETEWGTPPPAQPASGGVLHTGGCPCTDCALKDSLPHEATEPAPPSEGVGGSDCL